MRRVGYRGGLWLLLAPFLLGATALVLVPALVTAGFALTSYDSLSAPEFVGLDNLRSLAVLGEVRRSFVSTAVVVAVAVPLRVLGGLGLALLLARRGRVAGVGRVAAYLPSVLPDAATALLVLWLVNPLYGPVAPVVRAFGGTPGPVLLDPTGARAAVVVVAVLALGEGFLVLLAARRELPPVLEDVARLEGARGVGLFRRVTLPQLTPVLGLLFARDLVVCLQVTLVPILLLTRGGPLDATKTLPVLVYERGFRELAFGEAAALAVVLFGLTAVVVALQHRLLRRWNRAGPLTGR